MRFLKKLLQSHSLVMIICCAVPIMLFLILSLTGTLGSWGFYGLILLCPLLHVLMMRGHGHGRTENHVGAYVQSSDKTERMIAQPDVGNDNRRSRSE